MKLRGLLFLGYKQGINKQHYPSFLRAVAAPVGVVGSASRVEVSAIITKSVIKRGVLGVSTYAQQANTRSPGGRDNVGMLGLIGAALLGELGGEVGNHRDKAVNLLIFFAQQPIIELLALLVHLGFGFGNIELVNKFIQSPLLCRYMLKHWVAGVGIGVNRPPLGEIVPNALPANIEVR